MINRRSILGLLGMAGVAPSAPAKAIMSAAMMEAKVGMAAKAALSGSEPVMNIIKTATGSPDILTPALEAYHCLDDAQDRREELDYSHKSIRQSIDCFRSMSKSVKCVYEAEHRRSEREKDRLVSKARRLIRKQYGLTNDQIWGED